VTALVAAGVKLALAPRTRSSPLVIGNEDDVDVRARRSGL